MNVVPITHPNPDCPLLQRSCWFWRKPTGDSLETRSVECSVPVRHRDHIVARERNLPGTRMIPGGIEFPSHRHPAGGYSEEFTRITWTDPADDEGEGVPADPDRARDFDHAEQVGAL